MPVEQQSAQNREVTSVLESKAFPTIAMQTQMRCDPTEFVPVIRDRLILIEILTFHSNVDNEWVFTLTLFVAT